MNYEPLTSPSRFSHDRDVEPNPEGEARARAYCARKMLYNAELSHWRDKRDCFLAGVVLTIGAECALWVMGYLAWRGMQP